MEFSGPGSILEVESDLALSDDDYSYIEEGWPQLELQAQSSDPTPWQPKVLNPLTTTGSGQKYVWKLLVR